MGTNMVNASSYNSLIQSHIKPKPNIQALTIIEHKQLTYLNLKFYIINVYYPNQNKTQ